MITFSFLSSFFCSYRQLRRRRANYRQAGIEQLESKLLLTVGSLDPSFGTEGVVVDHYGEGENSASDIEILPDGDVLVASTIVLNGNTDFAVARYNSDGSIDGTFGVNGIASFDVGETDVPVGIEIQNDGRIIVGGNTTWNNGVKSSFAFLRLTSAGQLDATFGLNGYSLVTGSASFEQLNDFKLDDGDSIIGAGYQNREYHAWRGLTVKLTADGLADSSFGMNGKVTHQFSSHSFKPTAVDIGGTGDITIVGDTRKFTAFQEQELGVLRVDVNGNTKFFNRAQLPYNGSVSWRNRTNVTSIKVLPDESFYVGGSSARARTRVVYHAADAFLAKFNPNGQFDVTSSNKGWNVFQARSGDETDSIEDLQTDSDGRIVVTGGVYDGMWDSFTARLTYDGSFRIDAEFGSNGRTVASLSDGNDRMLALALQADGNIVTVGYASGASDTDVAVMRTSAPIPPAVKQVLVRNSQWSSVYSNGLSNRAEGSTGGYMRTDVFPDGRLPQAIDTIAITFSEDVTISADDVALTSGVAKQGGVSQEIPILSAEYDADTHTMVLTFAPPAVDTIKLTIDSTVSSVETNTPLAGEANPNSSDYNAVYTQVFRILPGDADHDGTVTIGTTFPNLGDLMAIYQSFGTHISGANFGRTYNFFADVNADGTVWQGDIFAMYANIGREEAPVPDTASFAPKISRIDALNIEEDAGPQSVAFSIGSSSMDASNLSVSVTSNNPALLLSSSIGVVGTNAERRLEFTPLPNVHGDATITVSVTDGSLTTESTFDLSISAVNDVPEFTATRAGAAFAFTPLSGLEFVPENSENNEFSNEFNIILATADPDVISDGDKVWFSATSTNESVARVFVAATKLRIETLNPGSSIVTVTSVDRAGEEVIKTIPVVVTLRDMNIGDIGNFAMLRTTREISNRQDRVKYLEMLSELSEEQIQELATRQSEVAELESHFFQLKAGYESQLSFGTQLNDIQRNAVWDEVFVDWQAPPTFIDNFHQHSEVDTTTANGQLFLWTFEQLVGASTNLEEIDIATKVGHLMDIAPARFLLSSAPAENKAGFIYVHLKQLFTDAGFEDIFGSTASGSVRHIAPNEKTHGAIYDRGELIRVRFDLELKKNGEDFHHAAVYADYDGQRIELPLSHEVSSQLFVHVPVEAISGFLPRTLDTNLPVQLSLIAWYGDGANNTAVHKRLEPIYVPASNTLTAQEEWEIVESWYDSSAESGGVAALFSDQTVLSNLFTGIAQELIEHLSANSVLESVAKARFDRTIRLASNVTGIPKGQFPSWIPGQSPTATGAVLKAVLENMEPVNRPGKDFTENIPNTIYILPRDPESNTLRAVVNLPDACRDLETPDCEANHPEDRRHVTKIEFVAATRTNPPTLADGFGAFFPFIDVSISDLGESPDTAVIHGDVLGTQLSVFRTSTDYFVVPNLSGIVTNERLSTTDDETENEILRRLNAPLDLSNGAWHNNIASSAHTGSHHDAIDFNISGSSDTGHEVLAATAGIVREIDAVQGAVTVEHTLPGGNTFKTVYLHMTDLFGVDYTGVRELATELEAQGRSPSEIDAALTSHIAALEAVNISIKETWLNSSIPTQMVIGRVGNEGFVRAADSVKRNSDGTLAWHSFGSHLHFATQYQGDSINLYKWLSASHIDIGSNRAPITNLRWSDSLSGLAVPGDFVILDRSINPTLGQFFAVETDGERHEVNYNGGSWRRVIDGAFWNTTTRTFQ